jgi:DNA-binding XRE family transcriptional regulator
MNTEKPNTTPQADYTQDIYDRQLSHYDKLPVGNKGAWVLVRKQCSILKERRLSLGLTQEQVAERARIHINQYQKFESGERELYSASFRVGVSICIVLRIDPSTFVTLPGYPRANSDVWML